MFGLRQRNFLYAGDPIPALNRREHRAFLDNLQKAALECLEQENLLTKTEKERCFYMLEEGDAGRDGRLPGKDREPYDATEGISRGTV